MRVRHYSECGICGTPGHSAKRCPLAEMEARKDPQGELARRQMFRTNDKEREAKKIAALGIGSPQTSRGFGM